MIQVTCAQCGLRILVPPTVQGRRGVCFGCGAHLDVPVRTDAPSPNEVRFAVGDRIADRYVIESELGRGGMGVVYKASDELISEEVALKFMNPRMLRTQRGQSLFIKEAQVARRLRHENIVAVHDVSTTAEGVLYLSMEYIKGASLRSVLRNQRRHRKLLDIRMGVDIVLQILAALEYAHKTVIHRDLKPENVMLLSGERAKVLDFGLALAIEDEPGPASPGPAVSNRVVGTLAYTAPEQRRHLQTDFRADLYTVGLMLQELLTLRTPLDEPISVMEARTDVAPSIIRTLDMALEEDRDRRWQSAREFREALEKAYSGSYRRTSISVFDSDGGIEVSTKNMVYLDGGNFLMGSNETREEAPEFEAYVEPFYIDTYPVTVEEYAAFTQATGYREPKFARNSEFSGERQPVTGVTWEDAQAYAAWVGKRLPAEKQWEFAARGRENRRFPWGHLEPDTTRCNFGDYLAMPSIVTMHEAGATPDGVFDMAGNVYEWTLDGFVAYNPGKNGGDNTGSPSPRRVVRGGSWHSLAGELRTSSRKGLFPETQLTTVGFRCALAAKGLRPKEAAE